MVKKTGRNDPCPCGSGRKYKHCCQQRAATPAVNPQSTELSIRKAMQVAWMYRQQGRLADAEAVCARILQASPHQPDALHLLGAIALQDGKVELAVDLIRKAIARNPNNPEYYSNLGLAFHEQGNLDLAIVNYRKAIAIHPGYADAYYNLHALLLNPDDMAPTIQCMQKVVEINPSDIDARFMLGLLLDYSGQAAAAAMHFELVEKSTNLYRARLDAWRHLKSARPGLPLTGSLMQTFRLGMGVAASDGLVLEFGVRNGNSIRQIAGLVSPQPVHGFDSFEGLPEVWHHEPKGSYTTKGEIPAVPHNVTLHVGWFEHTLPEFLNKFSGPVRFVNIDCDIYSSTRTVLEQLAPRVIAGTVMVFDEYIGNEHWREDEFRAFQEAVARYGWKYEYLCFSAFTKQVAVRISYADAQ